MRAICFSILLAGLLPLRAMAQGCSDAGFCTAGALNGTQTSSSGAEHSFLGLSVTAGAGENGVLIMIPQLEAGVVWGTGNILEVKLPYNITSGNLGSHSGVGDPVVSWSHHFSKKVSRWGFSSTLGLRVGIGRADAADKGEPLPMPYQSTLGTTDAIVGVSASWRKKISLAAGYQQPLLQYNHNGYLPADIYPATPDDSIYFASRTLKRRGDVLLRAEYNIRWGKTSIAVGPLFIYHLGRDRAEAINGDQIELKGSEGLTLNLAVDVSWRMKHYLCNVVAGTPLVVRDYRPDGLTRALVLTLRVRWQ